MIEVLQFMAAPFVMSIVLVGIHTYLGLHVVSRGVIFVDIALAQVAAVGSAFALLLGAEIGSNLAYFSGLIAAFFGAGILAMTRQKSEKIPQEAFIGITYAVASALMILVLTGVAHGAEQIKTLLVGSILWVKWSMILKTAILYVVIGILHWSWRKQFFLISTNPKQAFDNGTSVRFWDFMFYLMLGFVVTSSVQIAGVLLVFSFLVVPAVMGIMLADSTKNRLVVGWVLGVIVSFIGCFISYYLDLPTGATIIVTFGVVLVLVTGFIQMSKK